MDETEKKINNCVFEAWDQGFLAGQKAMAQTISDMGLMNEMLKELMICAITGYSYKIDQHIQKKQMDETVNRITRNIMDIMKT